MTSRDFVYWLQGMFELSGPKKLDENQTDLIKRHLAMVFIHEIDPLMPNAALDAAHKPPAVGVIQHPNFNPSSTAAVCPHDVVYRC